MAASVLPPPPAAAAAVAAADSVEEEEEEDAALEHDAHVGVVASNVKRAEAAVSALASTGSRAQRRVAREEALRGDLGAGFTQYCAELARVVGKVRRRLRTINPDRPFGALQQALQAAADATGTVSVWRSAARAPAVC